MECTNKKLSEQEFITPSNHINFKAKKLFDECGRILDGSVAYISSGGGGPVEQHTHEHNHLFIVIQGEAKILLADKTIIIKKNESFLVNGNIPHSVWNNHDDETIMIGITVS
ncbi:MAG: cupin domain-containing protein [Ruminococcus sp.]|nr:cupin domain-containing protein [Ruminococcus sp.]